MDWTFLSGFLIVCIFKNTKKWYSFSKKRLMFIAK